MHEEEKSQILEDDRSHSSYSSSGDNLTDQYRKETEASIKSQKTRKLRKTDYSEDIQGDTQAFNFDDYER